MPRLAATRREAPGRPPWMGVEKDKPPGEGRHGNGRGKVPGRPPWVRGGRDRPRGWGTKERQMPR